MSYTITLPNGEVVDVDDSIAPEKAAELIKQQKPELFQTERTLGGTLKDVGVTAAKGAMGLQQGLVGLADMVTGGYVGKGLEEVGVDMEGTQKMLSKEYSPAQQEAQARLEEKKGFTGVVQGYLENPSTIATGIGESIPSMAGGAAMGRQLMQMFPKMAGYLAGAVGEGTVGAGSAAEASREGNESGYLSGKEATAAALSGVGTGLFGFIGGKVASKLGINDIDTAITTGEFQQSAKGFMRRLAEGGISEGVFEELPQSVQEQMWANFAAGKPITEGVPEAAASGVVLGSVMGATAGGLGGKTPEVINRNPRENDILEAGPATPPPSDAVIFTDTDAAMQEVGPLAAQVEQALETGELEATPGPVEEPKIEVPDTAQTTALDAQMDKLLTRDVRQHAANFADPNTSVNSKERRVVRGLGTGADAFVGKAYGNVDLETIDTSAGPVILQVGEDSNVRPDFYNKAVMAELYDLAQEYNPRGVYVVLPQDVRTIKDNDFGLGAHVKLGNVHYIVPRHVTNLAETGSHVSKPDTEGAYSSNAKLQAGSTLWHEFGHSLIEDFILAGATPQEAMLIKQSMNDGALVPSAMKRLAPEARALISRWAALRKAVTSGSVTGREAAARWLSPAKLANKTLMKQTLKVGDKKLESAEGWGSKDLAKGLGEEWLSFMEFAAEQMAKFQMQPERLEKSKLQGALFPEGMGESGFEAALRKFFEPLMGVLQKVFGHLQARGFVGPDEAFTAWMDKLAYDAQVVSGVAKPKAKKAKAKKAKAVPEPVEDLEAEIDWEDSHIQNTLKASLASLVKDKILDFNSRVYKDLKQLLADGMYEEFVDNIEPLLNKKLRFDNKGNKAVDPLSLAGSKVSTFSGEPILTFSRPDTPLQVDGHLIYTASANPTELDKFLGRAYYSAPSGALKANYMNLLSAETVDAEYRGDFGATQFKEAIRQALMFGRDGVIFRNVPGTTSPIYVALTKEQLIPETQYKPEVLGGQLRFDRTSPDGDQMARMWELVQQKVKLPTTGRILAKVARMQFTFLQMQHLAHVHPDWGFLKLWEEYRQKYYRKTAELHSVADAVSRQLAWMGKEDLARMYRFTKAEYQWVNPETKQREHWTELVRKNQWHWEHKPTVLLLEKLKEFGVDVDTLHGKRFLELYIDAKNALQLQQDEMQRVIIVLQGQKYAANEVQRKKAWANTITQFKILREQPFWPQQTFGDRVIRAYQTDETGTKVLVYEAATDSDSEADILLAKAKKRYPSAIVTNRPRIQEEAILMRLPVEFLEDVSVALGLDPNNKEDAAKRAEIRELMQATYSKKGASTYDPLKSVIEGGSTDFLRNFADFSLRNSNFIAKMEFRKYFDGAAQLAKAESDALADAGNTAHSHDIELARKFMQDTVSYMMNPQEEAHQIRAFAAITYLWANMKTAVLNLWGFIHTWLYLNRELGFAEGTGTAFKGLGSSIRTLGHEGKTTVHDLLRGAASHAFTSVTDPNWQMVDGKPTELRQALEQAKRENVIDQSYAYYLAGQALRGDLMRMAARQPAGKAFKLTVDTGMAPFRVTELALRRGTFLAVYEALQIKQPGLNPEQRYEEAVRMTGLLQGDYTKGNRPRMMRGTMLSIITLFMTYVHNAAWGAYGGLEMGLRRQESMDGRASPSWYRSYTTQVLLLYLVAGGAEGMPFAENILDLLDAVWRRVSSDGKTARESLRGFLYENLEGTPMEKANRTSQFMRGLTWDIGGVDISRSVGLGRIVPGTDVFGSQPNNAKDVWGELAVGVSGIAGGYVSWLMNTGIAFNKIHYGLPFETVMNQMGKTGMNQLASLPGGIGGMAKAYQWATVDARGPQGGLLAHDTTTGKAREVTQGEIMMKALNFQPSAISRSQEAIAAQNDVKIYWQERRKGLNEQYFYAKEIARDREATADALKAMAQFDRDVPDKKLQLGNPMNKRSPAGKSYAQRLDRAEKAQNLAPSQKYLETPYGEVRELYGVQ